MFEDISREDLRDSAPPREVTVFSREDGGIVIQQGRPARGEDPCIVLTREQAGILIEAIERAIGPGK